MGKKSYGHSIRLNNRSVNKRAKLRKLTDREEIALALLLWKAYRSDYVKEDGSYLITEEHERACYKALTLAGKFGVKDEFLKLMMELPVMTIRVEELEAWERTEPEPPPSPPSTSGQKGYSLPSASGYVKPVGNGRPLKKHKPTSKR